MENTTLFIYGNGQDVNGHRLQPASAGQCLPHAVVQLDAGVICDLKDMVGWVPQVKVFLVQRKQIVAQR